MVCKNLALLFLFFLSYLVDVSHVNARTEATWRSNSVFRPTQGKAENIPSPTINTFWLNLKAKLEQFLEKEIDPTKYKYEIIGTVNEMKCFLGNRADAEISFEKLNLNSTSPIKSIVAVAYDANKKIIDSEVINIEVWIYKNIYVSNHAIAKGKDLSSSDISLQKLPIHQMDDRLFFIDNPKQKVTTINIAANTPIRVNMLRHERLVQSGDTLQINSGSGLIQLEFSCRAMGSGDAGDIINITCPNMEKKNHKARITSTDSATLL